MRGGEYLVREHNSASRTELKRTSLDVESSTLNIRPPRTQCNTYTWFKCFCLVGSPAELSDSPSHYLGPLGCDHKRVTQEHCNCIGAEIGAKWKKVLRNLGTKEEAIENLEENYTKVEEKCYKGLLEWSRSPLTQKATTKTLGDALRQEGCFKALETLSKKGIG